MHTLEEMSRRELGILERAGRAVGLMEEKDRELREGGVYAESAALHAAYVRLAAPPDSNLEALKRAIFLGWYETTEPSCFTGIADLNRDEVRRAHELLDAACTGGGVDAELEVMLGFYWFIADYHFTFNSSTRLRQYVSKLNPEAHKAFGFSRHALEGRGQMGHFWTSIACRVA